MELTVSGFLIPSWLAPMPAPQPLFFSILHQKLQQKVGGAETRGSLKTETRKDG